MSVTIETVRGPVPTSALGPTLTHEHIFIMQPEALQNWGHAFGPSYWDEAQEVQDAIATLAAVRDAGIQTIVDPTVPGLGRYIPRIQTINRGVDLHIIVATGVYAFLELPNFLAYRSVDAIAAAGDETGAPIMVHTDAPERTGLGALEALTDAGVDPARIVIAHAGDSNDLDYLRAIADTGASLGCDRFGIEHFNPLADRLTTLLALLDEGYGDRVLLSHDAACFFDFMVGDPFFADETPDYLLISNRVVPALRQAGVTQAQIDQMMIENPRRFFGGETAAERPRAPSAKMEQ
jgi:phosphotriesterase-related protein